MSLTRSRISAPALVNPAIAADHVSFDPTVLTAGVTSFLNAIASLTQGVDLTANYPTDFGAYGLVNWTLAGTYNETSISSVAPAPPVPASSPRKRCTTSCIRCR